VLAEQPAKDQRRQILAALGGEFKAVLDQIGWCRHIRCIVTRCARIFKTSRKNQQRAGAALREQARLRKKKEQGFRPAPKIVSTLFPRKLGFDLD
jgi:hypothetical protein